MRDRGFRSIDNELFKALLQADITRAGYKVLLTVIHFTIGYQKEVADVSLSTFQKMTGLARTSVIHAIRELERQQTLTVNRDGNSSIYKLRDRREWTGSVHATSNSSVHATSEDVKTLPVNVENATRTGSVPTPDVPPTPPKEKRKLLKKGGNLDDNLGSQGGNPPSSKPPSLSHQGKIPDESKIHDDHQWICTCGSREFDKTVEGLECKQCKQCKTWKCPECGGDTLCFEESGRPKCEACGAVYPFDTDGKHLGLSLPPQDDHQLTCSKCGCKEFRSVGIGLWCKQCDAWACPACGGQSLAHAEGQRTKCKTCGAVAPFVTDRNIPETTKTMV